MTWTKSSTITHHTRVIIRTDLISRFRIDGRRRISPRVAYMRVSRKKDLWPKFSDPSVTRIFDVEISNRKRTMSLMDCINIEVYLL